MCVYSTLKRKPAAPPRTPGVPEVGGGDWAALGAQDRETLALRFANSFYFGCEADDRTVGIASARHNGLGVDLNATLGSDIGHWDVARAEDVVPEAFGLVRHGVLTEEEFRSFSFGNAVRFLTSADPDFFAGTCIDSSAVASA